MTGIDPAPGEVGTVADLCRHGCYWDCEHRPSEARIDDASRASGALLPVHDDDGRALGRCRDCGGMFYAPLEHAREHERLRQLGLLASADILAEAVRSQRGRPRSETAGASIERR